jgi:hypothetical protein
MSISPICKESSCSGVSPLEAYKQSTNPLKQKETQKADGAVISEKAKQLAGQLSGKTIAEEQQESPMVEAKESRTEPAA